MTMLTAEQIVASAGWAFAQLIDYKGLSIVCWAKATAYNPHPEGEGACKAHLKLNDKALILVG